MKIMEVKDSKINKISEMLEDILYIGGKLMHCVEDLKECSMYNERNMSMKESRYGKTERPEDDEDYIYEKRNRKMY